MDKIVQVDVNSKIVDSSSISSIYGLVANSAVGNDNKSVQKARSST